jgi:hypothetical protein
VYCRVPKSSAGGLTSHDLIKVGKTRAIQDRGIFRMNKGSAGKLVDLKVILVLHFAVDAMTANSYEVK